MKKRLIAIISSAVIALAAIIGAVIVFHNDYSVYMIVESDGIAVSGEEILRNLTGETMEEAKTENLDGVTFVTSDTVYEKSGKLFMGEAKEPLAVAYPFFVNNGTAVFCINESGTAVTEDFEYVPTYQGLYISNGISFNQDMERAYREDFLFLQLSNGLFLNTMEMTVNSSDLPGTTLSGNCIISFFENEVRYYVLNAEGSFELHRITGLTEDSKVELDGSRYSYYDLLERLGLYEKEVLFEDIVDAVLTPTSVPAVNPKVTLTPTPMVTKTPPTPGVTEGEDEETGTSEGIGDGGNSGTATQNPQRPDGGKVTTTPRVKPTKVPVDRDRVTQPPQPTMTPMPAPTAEPAAPSGSGGTAVGGGSAAAPAAPAPAAPAAPAEPAQPNPPKPMKPGTTIWKKPTAVLTGDFKALVYSVSHNSLVVENEEFLHKSGITFEVKNPETGKLITRKAYGGSTDDIMISGLRPNTTYKIVVTMNYVDSKGNKLSEVLREGDIVTTLSMVELPPININWSNGTYRFPKKAELVGIQIEDYKATEALYLDMIQNIAKVELQFEARRTEENFKLSQKELKAFKNQETVDYMTPERLKTNTEYTYTFCITDKYNEAFDIEGSYSGTVTTAKKAPAAKIKVVKNEVKDIELTVTVENEDAAEIQEMCLLVKNSNGDTVSTAVYKDGVYEAAADTHSLTEDTTKIRFEDLKDYEVYSVFVYASYDIKDGHGVSEPMEIGKTKVVTASITSLGQAFYNVTVEPLAANSATVSVQLGERTNEKLAALIDEYEISFAKVIRDEITGEEIATDPEGIVVKYVAKESASTGEVTPGEGTTEDGTTENGTSENTPGEGETPENGDGTEGEELPEEPGEPPEESGPMDILFTAEDGKVKLLDYQLERIHGSSQQLLLSELDSVSEYRITIIPKVHLGAGTERVEREIRTNYRPNSFTTLKQTPFVKIDSAYVTGNRIRLFGVSVEDKDGAVLEYPLNMQVYDKDGRLHSRYSYTAEQVTDGAVVNEIVIDALNRYEEYTVRFFVAKYNDIPNSAAFEVNYELYYEPYVDSKEHLVFTTGEAVVGDLNFEGIADYKIFDQQELEVPVGAAGVTDKFTVYGVKKSPNALSYNTSSGELKKVAYETKGPSGATFKRYAPSQNTWSVVYKATVDFGDGEYNSMSVGYSHSSGGYPLKMLLYTEDPVVNNSAVPVAETELSGKNLTFNNYAIKWLDAAQFKSGAAPLTGVKTVYLEYLATDSSNYAWIGAFSGVIFRNIETTESEETFYANIAVDVNDTRGQLGDNAKYQIKVYKDGYLSDIQEHIYTSTNGVPAKEVNVYDVLHENGQDPQYMETIRYEGDDRQCKINFFYEVERNAAKGHDYEVELSVTIDGYEITLDKISFNSKEKVYGLRRKEDFTLIRWDMTASYVVLNDIDFGTWHWAQTGITSGLYFEGNLDFQGHTLTLNSIYSPIYNIGTNGVVENVVVNYAVAFTGQSTCIIAYNNYGTIRNILYERNSSNSKIAYYAHQGGITFYNRHSGVVENFVIELKDDWYVGQYAGAVTYLNWGTVRNGYMYGNPIRYVPQEYMDATQKSQANYVGALVSTNRVGATIENCYTLVDIYSSLSYRSGTDNFTFYVGSNRGKVQNCFSVGSVYYRDANGNAVIKDNVNPLYTNASSGGVAEAKRMYLYSEERYDGSALSQFLLERSVLHNMDWYEDLINNKAETSLAGMFLTDPVRHGFYPRLTLPASMPEQPWLMLPELYGNMEPTIIHTEVLEQGMDYALGEITFYNPNKTAVQHVAIEQFATGDIQIIRQYEEEEFWRIQIRVSNPKRCLSRYAITGFSLGSSENLITYSRTYQAGNYKYIDFEFYQPISDIAGWIRMNDDRTQNYRLYSDLDFAYYPMMQSVYIGNGQNPLKVNNATWASYGANFSGTLDGNGKTIRNLDLQRYGGLFESLYGGTIKDLTVENLNLNSENPDAPVNLRRGLVRNMGKNSVLDNVHVLGVKIDTASEITGGLVGYAHSGAVTIQNSSVHDAKITTTATNTGSNQLIGGILGQGAGDTIVRITNCYVDGLEINAINASAVGGIGGIVGYLTSGCTLKNLYVTDANITTYFQYTGGIAGCIIGQTYADGYEIQNVYVDADISSRGDIAGGLVGYAQQVNHADKVNALFLGNVSMINKEFNYVSRYIAYQTATTNLVKDGLYTYQELSYLNGRLNNEDRDDTDFTSKKDPYVYVTREMLLNPEFYTNGILVNGVYRNLDIGDGFALAYDVTDGDGTVTDRVTYAEEGRLPILLSADGARVLPYQEAHTIAPTEVQVTKITADGNPSNPNNFKVSVKISHQPNQEITGLTFDMNARISEGPYISRGTAETEIWYQVIAEKWVDRYYITELSYTEDDGTPKKLSVLLDSLMKEQFKQISSAEDWNEFMANPDNRNAGYNITITGDLDFTNSPNYIENVNVNRMLGFMEAEASWYRITGINRATNYPLIANAYGRISNFVFENIQLEKVDKEKTKNFGIIGHAVGNLSNVKFNNITIDSSYVDTGVAGRHAGGYANHVAPVGMLSGKASNVSLNGIHVQADATGITSTNTTAGFVGYANSTASFDKITAKNISVFGADRYYTAGIVGYMNGATKLKDITLYDFAIFGNVDTGSVAGYAAASTYGRTITNLSVKDGIMIGRVRVGGVFGQGYLVNYTDNVPSTVDNVFVMGDYHVGGAVGIGGASRNVTVKNSDVYGNYRVGGIVGYGNALATHCVDSVIASSWSRTDAATTNDLYQATVTKRKEAVEERLADSSLDAMEKRTLENANTYLGILLRTSLTSGEWRYQMWNKYSGTPAASKVDEDAQIGGISGVGQLLENNVVTGCTVGSITAEEVGGIVGHQVNIGYDTWSRTARVFSNACIDSTVTGAKNVGGIIGIAKRYTSSNNYSNATVSAVAPSKVTITDEGTNAGGIIGCINKTATYTLSDTPRLYSCYFAGTVSAANDYVGGIIGRCYQDVYGDNRDLMMVGTVKLTSDVGTHIQMIANRIENPTGRFVESHVYEGAKRIYGTNASEQTAEEYYLSLNADADTGVLPSVQALLDDVTLVTTDNLKSKDFWSKKSGNVQVGFTTTPTYWNFDGLSNGFMPYMTYRIYYGDNAAGNSVARYQEGFTTNVSGVKTYNYKTYNGGIPIPGYVAGRSLMMMRRPVPAPTLPVLSVYSVDVDKLNLEFDTVNTSATYTVTAKGQNVANGTVSQRVVTMQYDYRTLLTVTVSDGKESCEYTINPVDVSKTVMVYQDDYYYITGRGIEGSRPLLAGNFVSLIKGKALSADGRIYDVTTGDVIGKAGTIGLASEVMPLTTFTYDGNEIALYQGFSLSNGAERNGMHLYVKENTLFAVDSALTSDAYAVILDVLAEEEITSILANNDRIVDLKTAGMDLPEDFDNDDIVEMTNNLNSESDMVLVRYGDGGVVGFYYLTGGEFLNTGRSDGGSDSGDLFGSSEDSTSLNVTAAKSYQQLQTFEQNLIASGWAEVEGTNQQSGTSSISGENGKSDENGNPVGGSASESGSNLTSGTETKAGTNTEGGTGLNTETQIGSAVGDEKDVTERTEGTETGETDATTGDKEEPESSGTQTGSDTTESGEVVSGEASNDVTAGSSETSGETSGSESSGTGAFKENTSSGGGMTGNGDEAYQNAYTEVRNNGGSYGRNSAEAKFVPFFDAELNEYVLYDEAELLSATQTAVVSMNEKVKLSGHMIDRHIPYVDDMEKMDDSNRNGLILMLLTVAGVALLLGILIYKHQNGGKANEED